jgi:hypothetical protein
MNDMLNTRKNQASVAQPVPAQMLAIKAKDDTAKDLKMAV